MLAIKQRLHPLLVMAGRWAARYRAHRRPGKQCAIARERWRACMNVDFCPRSDGYRKDAAGGRGQLLPVRRKINSRKWKRLALPCRCSYQATESVMVMKIFLPSSTRRRCYALIGPRWMLAKMQIQQPLPRCWKTDARSASRRTKTQRAVSVHRCGRSNWTSWKWRAGFIIDPADQHRAS